jgi:hypothetical protein
MKIIPNPSTISLTTCRDKRDVMQILGVRLDDRIGDDSDFVTFRLAEVNYINLYRARKSSELVPVYHTADGSFAPILTLKDLSAALKPYGFSYFDKSTIVNRHRIKRIVKGDEGLNITFVDFSATTVSHRSRLK